LLGDFVIAAAPLDEVLADEDDLEEKIDVKNLSKPPFC